jgi:PTH1 family peptidyl-tRNA hydrolase
MFVIAGLGNPGSKLDKTRHNMGFDAIDLMAEKYNIKVNKLKHKALIGDGTINNEKVLLVKPQTYMNLSGESIREAMEWYKVPVENLIVLYDDVDIPIGRVRVRPSGSSGTHNGMKSVIYQLQSDAFPRVRIGIGRAPEGWDMADFVLGKFSPEERKAVDSALANAVDAAVTIISSGVEKAMGIYNGK